MIVCLIKVVFFLGSTVAVWLIKEYNEGRKVYEIEKQKALNKINEVK